MERYYRRVFLGALARPDAIFHWAAGTLRLRENLAHPAPRRTRTPDLGSTLKQFGFDAATVARNLENARIAYHEMEADVYALYGVSPSGRPPSIITESDAVLLYALVRSRQPDLVVETGVSDGMSSAIILRALEENRRGRLRSIDFPLVGLPRIYGRPPGWLVPPDLRARWTVDLGPSSRRLRSVLRQEQRVDVFVHDSEHSRQCMAYEFREALAHLSPGGLLVVDDAFVNDAFDVAARAVPGCRSILTAEGMGVLQMPTVSVLPEIGH